MRFYAALRFTFATIVVILSGCNGSGSSGSAPASTTSQATTSEQTASTSPLTEANDGEASWAALNVLKARGEERDGALYNVAEDCESQIRDAKNETIESARALEWKNARAFCVQYAKDFCRNPNPGTSTYNKCEIFNRIKQS